MTRTSPERERQQTQQRLAVETREADMAWLLGSPRGRRLVWAWLNEWGVFRPSFLPGMDAATAAHREGERNAALRLLTEVQQHAPVAFIQMQIEARAHIAEGSHDSAQP